PGLVRICMAPRSRHGRRGMGMHAPRIRRSRRARVAWATGALALLGGVTAAGLTLAADPVLPPPPPVCTTSPSPTAAYSVTVCLAIPNGGSRLRGPALLTGTVATEGVAPSV